MILSFAIFITFAVFLYSVLQPAIKTDSDKKFILEYLKTEMVKNISSELITTSVVIDEKYKFPPKPCFKINKAFPGNVIVKDSNKVMKSSSSTDDLITVAGIDTKERFYWVLYSSEFFVPDLVSCSNPKALIPEDMYKIGFVTKKNYVFAKKAGEFIEEYNLDYNSQKERLGVLGGIEYGFGFKGESGNLIETNFRNVTTDIYIEEIPTEYIDSDGALKFGYVYVKVW